MRCAWEQYLAIVPPQMRKDVDLLGRDRLKELRLRIGFPAELVLQEKNISLKGCVQYEDIRCVIQTASKYSAWAADTSRYGYITAPGGHRIGICGEAVTEGGRMRGIRRPSSLCLRVARQFSNIAKGCENFSGSVLIIGPPGSGKTTLLREWIRNRSEAGNESIGVVDERQELFPRIDDVSCFDHGRHTDVLSGCSKAEGLECILKAMTPSCIAVDEITSQEDCDALIQCMWSGVQLLATAHAFSAQDLHKREIYKKLLDAGMFQTLVILDQRQSWHAERMR